MLNHRTKKNVSYYINFNDLKHFITCENKSLNVDYHLLHKYYGSSYSRIIKRTYVNLWSTPTTLIISYYKSKILTNGEVTSLVVNIMTDSVMTASPGKKWHPSQEGDLNMSWHENQDNSSSRAPG